MYGRGRNHPGGGANQSGNAHRHNTRPCARTGQDQYHDQSGHQWPQQQHHQSYHGHHPQQNNTDHHQQRLQHQHHQNQERRQDEPALFKTGGRPWTMYQRNAPRNKCGRSPAGIDTSDGSAAACNSTVGEGKGEDRGKEMGTQFTVVSYNVLADSLVSFDYIPYCRTWNDAAWKARPRRILQKVLEFRPAVVCLQEVDQDLYEVFFRKELESSGYVGAYCRRSGGKLDGCATFVLGHQLRLVEQEAVAYKIQGHPVLDRDNVALLVVVDVLSPEQSQSQSETPQTAPGTASPDAEGSEVLITSAATACTQPREPSRESGTPTAPASDHRSRTRRGSARLVIANTHLLFNPKRGDIKAAQLMVLTSKVERLAKSSGADGVMICGDFNMTPDSALYHYMVEGAVNMDGLNRFVVSGQCGLTNRMQYDQRKETDNSGVMPYRECGSKHQGSGCSLGSFLRPTASPATTGGGRGWIGGRRQGRDGRGNKHFRRDATSPPHQPRRQQSCETCPNRRPHDASCAYVTVDDPTAAAAAADYRHPPGAPPGALFAVMDPVSCRCITAGRKGSSGDGGSGGGTGASGNDWRLEEGVSGKREALGGEGAGASNEFHRGRETYDPPILWPVQGGKFAYRRDRGPVVHNLGLKSVYAQQGDAWGTGEPAFSSYHHMFKGTVDYIFYGPGPPSETASSQEAIGKSIEDQDPTSADEATPLPGRGETVRLRCVGVAEPPLRCDLDQFGGLPSPAEPSDHVLLAARFEVTIP